MFIDYTPRYKKLVIKITKARLDKIKAFAPKLAEAKMKEWHYKQDGNSLAKRLITGLTGEAAVEQILGLRIIDWTIGNSQAYNKPDVEKLGVGIKTVEYGLHPLVPVNPKYPQIICVKMSEEEVIVCGLATVLVLKKYQDLDLVRAPGARARGTKAGFYGFQYLKRFGNLKELKGILKK